MINPSLLTRRFLGGGAAIRRTVALRLAGQFGLP